MELSLLDIGCIHLSANIFQLFCNYYNLDFFKLQPYFMFLNHQTMNKVITSYSLILVATCSPTHPSKQKVHLHSPLLLYLLRIPPQFFSSQLSVETDMLTRHLQYCKCLRVLYVLSISHSAFGTQFYFVLGHVSVLSAYLSVHHVNARVEASDPLELESPGELSVFSKGSHALKC